MKVEVLLTASLSKIEEPLWCWRWSPGGHDEELHRGHLRLVDDEGHPGPRPAERQHGVVVEPQRRRGWLRRPAVTAWIIIYLSIIS